MAHDRDVRSLRRGGGPTRLGPPGQASLYFNDPFGNRLELVTLGFTGEIPVGAPDVSALEYTWTGT
ncbi:hypothetical protein WMF20_01680 [Sorangium sp. So ce834]|uniref:hypothetical protein n=1 Tax=Sorangium sp. So ce834 TaxID=3133321 RepID=UPI003F61BCBB